MKAFFKILFIFLLVNQSSVCQEKDNAQLLKILLTKYYANEKVIVKNRIQFLHLYCTKAPNNEETLEVINKNELLKKNATQIKKEISINISEDWSKEYNLLFQKEHQYLKSKVNKCTSFEEFQKIATQIDDNNKRLMIISKPIYFAKKYCLVKVAFYRNVEHNSGLYFLFENINGTWTIKETLNEWNT
jgi:hypothetical protein